MQGSDVSLGGDSSGLLTTPHHTITPTARNQSALIRPLSPIFSEPAEGVMPDPSWPCVPGVATRHPPGDHTVMRLCALLLLSSFASVRLALLRPGALADFRRA